MDMKFTWSKDWTIYAAIATLLATAAQQTALLISRHHLGDLQIDSLPVTLNYAAERFYYETTLPTAGAELLLAVGLLTIWLLRLTKKQPVHQATAAAGLAIIAFITLIPLAQVRLNTSYTHLETLAANGRQYHLGLSHNEDGQEFYVCSSCDNNGMVCVAKPLSAKVSAGDGHLRWNPVHQEIEVETKTGVFVGP